MASDGTDDKEETDHLAPEDSDLEDLLSHPEQGQAPLNSGNEGIVPIANAYLQYACYTFPRLCTCFAIMGVGLLMVLFVNLVFNPTESFGSIPNDYTGIQSKYEMDVGKIDHWCIQGDNDSCRCEDPLEPSPRAEYKSWTKAHMLNKKAVKANLNVDVAFLGESLIEEMDGKWMGRTAPSLANIERTFKKHFQKGDVSGVALGIAGDTSPNVLWRLLHGEAPDEFNPKIWWLSLGMNDLGRMQCSEEVVVMGILRVVEEIMTRKPNAKIVINSMLPMADLRGGIYPTNQDFQDAFVNKKGGKIPASHFAQGGSTNKNNQKKNEQGNGRFLKKNNNKNNNNDDDEPQDGKMTKKQMKKFKRDPVNPKMKSEQNTIKKYDAKKLFLKLNRLPLWTSITAINRQLSRFAQKNSEVTFFDATPLFAERTQGDQYMLLSERISIRGHPTEEGYQVWEDAVKDMVDKLLRSIEAEEEESEAAPKPEPTLKEKDSDDDMKEMKGGD